MTAWATSREPAAGALKTPDTPPLWRNRMLRWTRDRRQRQGYADPGQHVVPLGDAWRTGAQLLTEAYRCAYVARQIKVEHG